MSKQQVTVNLYAIVSQAVEIGTARGWRLAHKHTDNPGEEVIKQHIEECVMTEIAERIEF